MTGPAITTAAVAAMVAEVAHHGAAGVETGGFLLVPRSDPTLTVVAAMAGAAGIARRPDQLIISGPAVDVLSEWADDRDLRIAVQFHSHATAAFLSPIDRRGGVRVDGFISTVLPTFHAPPPATSRWGWYRFADGDWNPRPAPATVAGATQTIRFDEVGVDDR
jgi:hypothetical protein